MRRLGRLIGFLGFYAVELVRANLQVTVVVLAPRPAMQPAVVPVPIRSTTDLELTILTALVALTPGTLPLEIDRARGVLVVHALRTPTTEDLREQVHDLENRLLGVMR